jgi:hypothetical protein
MQLGQKNTLEKTYEKKKVGPCHFCNLIGHIMHHYHELTQEMAWKAHECQTKRHVHSSSNFQSNVIIQKVEDYETKNYNHNLIDQPLML